MSIDNPLGQDVFLKSKAVKTQLGNCSDATLWRRLRDPVLPFPQPVSLGGQTRFWRESEVAAWIVAKSAASADQPKHPQPTKPEAGHHG
jgi:predicted DNA-binding transcriptional regulator AlpA